MIPVIGRREFEILKRKAIRCEDDPRHKKIPYKEEALFKLLYESGRDGATIGEMIECVIQALANKTQADIAGGKKLTEDQRDDVAYKKKLDSSKRKDVYKSITNIKDKLDRFYKSTVSREFEFQYLINDFHVGGETRFRIETRHPIETIANLIAIASESFNFDLITNEINILVRCCPIRVDYLGTAFNIAFESTPYKTMMLENIQNHEESMYRFLMPHPFSEYAKNRTKFYNSHQPVAHNIIDRIKYCEEEFKKIKSLIPSTHKDRLLMKYYSRPRFFKARFLIVHSKELHFKISQPELNQKYMFIFNHKSFMFTLANEAFELMWNDEGSIQV